MNLNKNEAEGNESESNKVFESNIIDIPNGGDNEDIISLSDSIKTIDFNIYTCKINNNKNEDAKKIDKNVNIFTNDDNRKKDNSIDRKQYVSDWIKKIDGVDNNIVEINKETRENVRIEAAIYSKTLTREIKNRQKLYFKEAICKNTDHDNSNQNSIDTNNNNMLDMEVINIEDSHSPPVLYANKYACKDNKGLKNILTGVSINNINRKDDQDKITDICTKDNPPKNAVKESISKEELMISDLLKESPHIYKLLDDTSHLANNESHLDELIAENDKTIKRNLGNIIIGDRDVTGPIPVLTTTSSLTSSLSSTTTTTSTKRALQTTKTITVKSQTSNISNLPVIPPPINIIVKPLVRLDCNYQDAYCQTEVTFPVCEHFISVENPHNSFNKLSESEQRLNNYIKYSDMSSVINYFVYVTLLKNVMNTIGQNLQDINNNETKTCIKTITANFIESAVQHLQKQINKFIFTQISFINSLSAEENDLLISLIYKNIEMKCINNKSNSDFSPKQEKVIEYLFAFHKCNALKADMEKQGKLNTTNTGISPKAVEHDPKDNKVLQKRNSHHMEASRQQPRSAANVPGLYQVPCPTKKLKITDIQEYQQIDPTLSLYSPPEILPPPAEPSPPMPSLDFARPLPSLQPTPPPSLQPTPPLEPVLFHQTELEFRKKDDKQKEKDIELLNIQRQKDLRKDILHQSMIQDEKHLTELVMIRRKQQEKKKKEFDLKNQSRLKKENRQMKTMKVQYVTSDGELHEKWVLVEQQAVIENQKNKNGEHILTIENCVQNQVLENNKNIYTRDIENDEKQDFVHSYSNERSPDEVNLYDTGKETEIENIIPEGLDIETETPNIPRTMNHILQTEFCETVENKMPITQQKQPYFGINKQLLFEPERLQFRLRWKEQQEQLLLLQQQKQERLQRQKEEQLQKQQEQAILQQQEKERLLKQAQQRMYQQQEQEKILKQREQERRYKEQENKMRIQQQQREIQKRLYDSQQWYNFNQQQLTQQRYGPQQSQEQYHFPSNNNMTFVNSPEYNVHKRNQQIINPHHTNAQNNSTEVILAPKHSSQFKSVLYSTGEESQLTSVPVSKSQSQQPNAQISSYPHKNSDQYSYYHNFSQINNSPQNLQYPQRPKPFYSHNHPAQLYQSPQGPRSLLNYSFNNPPLRPLHRTYEPMNNGNYAQHHNDPNSLNEHRITIAENISKCSDQQRNGLLPSTVFNPPGNNSMPTSERSNKRETVSRLRNRIKAKPSVQFQIQPLAHQQQYKHHQKQDQQQQQPQQYNPPRLINQPYSFPQQHRSPSSYDSHQNKMSQYPLYPQQQPLLSQYHKNDNLLQYSKQQQHTLQNRYMQQTLPDQRSSVANMVLPPSNQPTSSVNNNIDQQIAVNNNRDLINHTVTDVNPKINNPNNGHNKNISNSLVSPNNTRVMRINLTDTSEKHDNCSVMNNKPSVIVLNNQLLKEQMIEKERSLSLVVAKQSDNVELLDNSDENIDVDGSSDNITDFPEDEPDIPIIDEEVNEEESAQEINTLPFDSTEQVDKNLKIENKSDKINNENDCDHTDNSKILSNDDIILNEDIKVESDNVKPLNLSKALYICIVCTKNATDLCQSCVSATYCSKECQIKNSKSHMTFCKNPNLIKLDKTTE